MQVGVSLRAPTAFGGGGAQGPEALISTPGHQPGPERRVVGHPRPSAESEWQDGRNRKEGGPLSPSLWPPTLSRPPAGCSVSRPGRTAGPTAESTKTKARERGL